VSGWKRAKEVSAPLATLLLPAHLLVALLFAASPALAAPPRTEEASFQLVTRDGRTQTGQGEPAIQRGMVYLAQRDGTILSVPLEEVDWPATRALNRQTLRQLLDRWEEGPPRYLLRPGQAREYRSLKYDDERARWISRFWAEVDPTPDTFENETRREYWSRVLSANRLFNDSTKPGWKTDRGKVYLLLGPPSQIESFPMRSGNDARFSPEEIERAGSGPLPFSPARGVERWYYRNLPGGRFDPETIIAFRQDSTGEYYLSDEGMDYDRIFADRIVAVTQVAASAAPARPGGPATRSKGLRVGPFQGSTLSLLGDLGAIQQEAINAHWLDEIVRSREYFGVFPMRSLFHAYRSQEELTYLEINLSIDEGPEVARAGRSPAPTTAPLLLAARLISENEPSQVVEFPLQGGFAALPDPEGVPGRWLFQSGAGVPPGSYLLLVAVTHEPSGATGSWRERVVVPDLSSTELALSDIALASRLEAVAAPAPGAVKQPFRHGSLRVVPDVDHIFKVGSELAFCFQIYGARGGEASGPPSLDHEYRIERLVAEGAQPMGNPLRLEAQRELSRAFAFPLAGWPVGRYRLTVRVVDRGSGGTAERQVDFSVEE
jgi:GWxTD domain-containing protein